MQRRRNLCAVLLLTILGCGHRQTDGADVPTPPPMESDGESVSENRVSAADVLVAVREDAMMAGFVDARRLSETGWLSALLRVPIPKLQTRLTELRKACGTDPFGIVDRLAWNVGPGGETVVVAKLAVPVSTAMSCIRGVRDDAEHTTVAGRDALRFGPVVIVDMGDATVIAGTVGWVGAFLDGEPPAGGSLRASVAPERNTLLRFAGEPGDHVTHIHGSLSDEPQRLAFDMELTVNNAAAATEMAENLRPIRQQMNEAIADDDGLLLPELIVRVQGPRVRLAFEVVGSANKQAAMGGVLSAIAIYSVRRYLAQAETSEARANIEAIARALTATIAGGRRRFPPSAPAVPNEVPPAMKYQSAASDWQHPSWKSIGFSLDAPQYYSYAFKTSKDGMSCVIIARGDLDGDGVSSKFSLELTIETIGGQDVATAGQVHAVNELE